MTNRFSKFDPLEVKMIHAALYYTLESGLLPDAFEACMNLVNEAEEISDVDIQVFKKESNNVE
jgi:hypothetical protein